MMPELVEVELYSTEPSAVAAVRATLAQLPGAPALTESEDGRYFVPDGFPAWACERQGYVKKLLRK